MNVFLLILLGVACFGFVIALAKIQESNMAVSRSSIPKQFPVPPGYQAAWNDEADIMTPQLGIALVLDNILNEDADRASGV
jgi:hypothetical protein